MDRKDLQDILETIVSDVYFQPPENFKLQYPCIVYERDRLHSVFSSNKMYKYNIAYTIIFITKAIDTAETLLKIASLPMCRHDRHYKAENLNHDVFKIYT